MLDTARKMNKNEIQQHNALVHSISKEDFMVLEGENGTRTSFGFLLTISVTIIFFNILILMNKPTLRTFVQLRGSSSSNGIRETMVQIPGNDISAILLPQLQTLGENEFLLTDYMSMTSESSSEAADKDNLAAASDSSATITGHVSMDIESSSPDGVFSDLTKKVEVF